jgi:hypothetical protein
MDKIIYIYFLHKNDNTPFYIGKTNNIKKRKLNHKQHFGFNICLEVIDKIPSNEWKFWEKHYISLFKSWGFNLMNKNNGGNGPEYFPEEAKLKLSKLFKGRICPNKGKKFKNVASKANVGRKNKYIIYQYDLDGNLIKEWLKPKDIVKYLKHDFSGIRQVCVGKQSSAYGFKWSWKLIK